MLSTLVQLLACLTLAIASYLKFVASVNSASSPADVGLDPSFGLAVLEMALALWIAGRGLSGFGGWAAAAFFAATSTYSGWMYRQGQSNCGCFGNVQVNPGISLLLSASLLAGILACLARGKAPGHGSSERSAWVSGVVGLGLLISFTLIAIERHRPGSLPYWLVGRGSLSLPETQFDSSIALVSGSYQDLSVRVVNRSPWRPIQILGIDCQCSGGFLYIHGLPMTLQPQQEKSISIGIRWQGMTPEEVSDDRQKLEDWRAQTGIDLVETLGDRRVPCRLITDDPSQTPAFIVNIRHLEKEVFELTGSGN